MVTVLDPNIVDWGNLSQLISNIPTIFPGIIALITGMLPLIFIGAIVMLVIGIFDGVVDIVKGIVGVFKRQ
jgi:hypothetical protein